MPRQSAKSSVPATYTTLVPQHVVKKQINVVDGEPLRYLLGRGNAQSDFGRFRIAAGDIVIPIHIDRGRICPIARMTVVFKGTVAAWNLDHPDRAIAVANSAWAQVLVGDRGTPQRFMRPLPDDVVRDLRYDGSKGPRALEFLADGRLKKAISVDGVFRLLPESADALAWLKWI